MADVPSANCRTSFLSPASNRTDSKPPRINEYGTPRRAPGAPAGDVLGRIVPSDGGSQPRRGGSRLKPLHRSSNGFCVSAEPAPVTQEYALLTGRSWEPGTCSGMPPIHPAHCRRQAYPTSSSHWAKCDRGAYFLQLRGSLVDLYIDSGGDSSAQSPLQAPRCPIRQWQAEVSEGSAI